MGRISRGKGDTFGGLEILKHSGNHESKRDNILNGEGEERLIDVGIQPGLLPSLLAVGKARRFKLHMKGQHCLQTITTLINLMSNNYTRSLCQHSVC